METKFQWVVGVILLSGYAWTQNVAASDRLDDATILAIFDQANAADVYIGRIGAQKGYSEEVRELGRMVATDHVAVQQMGRDVAKKLSLIPTPPAQDNSVGNQAKTVALLQSKSGKDFDKTYVKHEIEFHQAVVDAVKNTLLPSSSSEELKTLIRTVLPGFEHHLAETKAVAKKLGFN